MDVFLRKSTFCSKLTQILYFEETDNNGTFIALQIEVFKPEKYQISCTGKKCQNWQFIKWHF